mgnify:FL=1
MSESSGQDLGRPIPFELLDFKVGQFPNDNLMPILSFSRTTSCSIIADFLFYDP